MSLQATREPLELRSAVILIANNSTFVSLHSATVTLITSEVMGQAQNQAANLK